MRMPRHCEMIRRFVDLRSSEAWDWYGVKVGRGRGAL